MKIADFVHPDLVVANLAAKDKPGVIKELATHVAGHVGGVDAEALFKILMERERLASTAIGDGVAIPHGKLDAIGKLIACIGRAETGVDFDSMDGRPTHLFFVLVAPENSTGIHLKALARISRLFKDPDFRSRLMSSSDAAVMYQTIVDEDAKY